VAGLLRYLFEECRLHRVRAVCDAENPASARYWSVWDPPRSLLQRKHLVKGAWVQMGYAILESE
jgi:hypothetical protein